MTTDPKSQYFSPYLAMGNTPMNSIDPDGGSTEVVPPWALLFAVGAAIDYAGQVSTNLGEGKSLGTSLIDVDVFDIGISGLQTVSLLLPGSAGFANVGGEYLKNVVDYRPSNGFLKGARINNPNLLTIAGNVAINKVSGRVGDGLIDFTSGILRKGTAEVSSISSSYLVKKSAKAAEINQVESAVSMAATAGRIGYGATSYAAAVTSNVYGILTNLRYRREQMRLLPAVSLTPAVSTAYRMPIPIRR
jgi:hypothetical protein